MAALSKEYTEGFNDGYWLGRENSYVAKVIYGALQSPSSEYGKGIRSGFELGLHYHKQRQLSEMRKENELRELRGRKSGKEIDRDR